MAENYTPFNVCGNWGLKCFDMKAGEKGVTLNCVLNGKKKEDGTYTKGMSIRVWCSFEKCDIPEDDYSNCYINVDGQISVSDYKKQDGTLVSQLTVFANKVRKKVWDN